MEDINCVSPAQRLRASSHELIVPQDSHPKAEAEHVQNDKVVGEQNKDGPEGTNESIGTDEKAASNSV